MLTVDDAIRRIAMAYENLVKAETFEQEDIWSEKYETLIAVYAKRLNIDENWLEDSALDYYHFGPDCCG